MASPPRAVPLVFLETRQHLDLPDLGPLAAQLGPMILRLDQAIRATGDIARVHIHRWGDGGSHFHMWFYGRPVGAKQLTGTGMALWADILPPVSEEHWPERMAAIARKLSHEGGADIG